MTLHRPYNLALNPLFGTSSFLRKNILGIQYMYYHFCPEKNTKNKKEVEEVGRHSKMLGQYSVRSVTRAIVVSLS